MSLVMVRFLSGMLAMLSVSTAAKPENVHAYKNSCKEQEKPVIANPFHDLPPFSPQPLPRQGDAR
jgi:hypothetical protein